MSCGGYIRRYRALDVDLQVRLQRVESNACTGYDAQALRAEVRQGLAALHNLLYPPSFLAIACPSMQKP
jgi:hypothetical protein